MHPAPIRTGMPATSLGPDGWIKPWSGPNGGDCLEAKKLPDGRVALRQSTDPHGPALIFEPSEITRIHQRRQKRPCRRPPPLDSSTATNPPIPDRCGLCYGGQLACRRHLLTA